MNLESISIKYNGSKLSLVDQTLLPFAETWVDVDSPEEMFQVIKTLKVRGAPLIGVAAALCLALYSKTEKSAELFKSKAMYLSESLSLIHI